ncbi:hypothetical protein BDA96_02G231100 [Sorghum bicolor]|uniref:Uncharacterized protein n=1 Tax=Sorghum bicolor TaxID=4558 RepID=A0A921UWC2_SORBI|nr:hypothetical protein BDA96_02G231100 [Sorghum bicolor]
MATARSRRRVARWRCSILMTPPAAGDLFSRNLTRWPASPCVHGGASRDLIRQDIKDWSVMQCLQLTEI